MTALNRTLATVAIPFAMLLSATAAQAQVEDLAIPVTSCTPNTGPSLTQVQMNTLGGFVRANNVAAGQVAYTCNLLDSYVGFVPSWTRFGLQYRDAAGGRITLTIYSKNKITGAAAVVGAIATPASAVINNVSAALPALNFAVNSYYAVVRMVSAAVNPPEAHLVRVEQ